MLTWPEIKLIKRPWTKCGLTRPGPFSASSNASLSMPGRPPIPEPIEQPARSFLFFGQFGEARIFESLACGIYAVNDKRIDLTLDLMVHAFVGVKAPWMVLAFYFATQSDIFDC